MDDIRLIPMATTDEDAQSAFNRLTVLLFELDHILADPILLPEIKEICTKILKADLFSPDRTLIHAHGHGAPQNLVDIVVI